MLRILDQWLQLLFSGVALCLALEFMLRIFAPGNADTAWIFQAIHPIESYMEAACYFLTQPVDKISALVVDKAPFILHWIPTGLKANFPVMSASVAARHIAQWLLLFPHDPHGRYAHDLLAARYNILFPGVVDWRLMVALPIWGWVESLISAIIRGLETLAYRQSLRSHERAALQKFQEQRIEPNSAQEQQAV